MNSGSKVLFDELFSRYPRLEVCRESIARAYACLDRAYRNGGMLLVCGNGGSAADAEHITGELMKGFLSRRPLGGKLRQEFRSAFPEDGDSLAEHLQGALPTVSLVSQSGLCTAFGNDVAPDMIFAQQVYGYFRPGNVLLGISTSGNSRNVVNAAKTARALGNESIALTGESGGDLKRLCSACICVPETETPKVQELHLPVYHALCAMLEAEFFPE